jgi:hypothetical protein
MMIMDKEAVIPMIVGSVTRILLPLFTALFAHFGFAAAEAQPWANDLATGIAGGLGVIVSVWWSYKSRRALEAKTVTKTLANGKP